MTELNVAQSKLVGPAGEIPLLKDDEVAWKLAMLVEGECEGGAAVAEVCRKFGYSRQWYYKLLEGFKREGTEALRSRRTGPKSNYRRDDEVERQVVRYRALDPEAGAGVIAQRLRQNGFSISERTVHRVIADYGLQKKNPRGGPQAAVRRAADSAHQEDDAR